MKKILLLIFLCTNVFLHAQNLKITYNYNDYNAELNIYNSLSEFTSNSINKTIVYSDLNIKKHYLLFNGLPIKELNAPCLIDISSPYNWKITNETKNILGYKCTKAVTTITRTNVSYSVTAWFANQLKYQIGPKGTFGLPGLILEIQSENSELNCIASSIVIHKNIKQIKIPKYKILSLQNFNDILKKKTGVIY